MRNTDSAPAVLARMTASEFVRTSFRHDWEFATHTMAMALADLRHYNEPASVQRQPHAQKRPVCRMAYRRISSCTSAANVVALRGRTPRCCDAGRMIDG